MTPKERYLDDLAQLEYISQWKQKQEAKRMKHRQAIRRFWMMIRGE